MKHLIMILGTTLLGIFLFQMMVGDQPQSLKSTARDFMIYSVRQYAEQEGDGT